MPDIDPQNVFLGRQPILDRNQQLFAYELLFRSAGADQGNFASFIDGNQATATVIVNTFSELSLADALGPYQGFIKVDQGLLFSDLINALPPHTVVLEILPTVAQTAEMIARCEQLRQAGYVLATHVRPESLDVDGKPLLRIAQIIKVDVSRVEPERLRQLAPALKPLRKTLLAEKVESNAQMRLCHELGFDLFEGYYFARPTVIEGKRLQSSETALLRLLGLISQDADTAAIEAVFKQEPVLTINLLRLTNSAGSGLATRITSLRHAITLLGRRQLQRWLQLLIYTNPKSGGKIDNPLLPLAATRGRLLELLAERLQPHSREFADQGFMVGIMSLMPALLDVPMEEILKHLPVAQRVRQALVDQGGLLGQMLQLALATEQTDPEVLAEALRRVPGVSVEFLENCLHQAFYWANNLGREKVEDA